MLDVLEIIKNKYPSLISRMKVRNKSGSTTIEIPFANQRYSLWLIDENSESFIVGVNFLHCHFDLESPEFNLNAALEYFDDIINDEVVAIGNKSMEIDYLIATMDRDKALDEYKAKDDRIEIVSFNKSY